MSEEDLLKLAMGLGSIEPTDEDKKQEFKDEFAVRGRNSKERLDRRRALRKEAFFVIKQMVRETESNLSLKQIALKELIEGQLDKNLAMDWHGFTFVWDIHPDGTPVVVRKEAWVKAGGGFDSELGTHYPSAFTEQVIE